MRRTAFLAVCGLLISGCSSAADGAPVSGALPPLAEAAASVAARDTVLRFLEAYERAPADGGASLAALAGSAPVQHWAVWLGVQFQQVDGSVEGSHVLRGIGPMQPFGSAGETAFVAEIAATVNFLITPQEGPPQRQTRSLDGLIALAHDRDASWRVVDFTRDGVPLSNSVHVFPPGAGTRDRGVTIAVDSFILDADQWAIGVFMDNDTGRTIRVEPEFVGVYDLVAQPVDTGIAPSSLEAIEPGDRVGALIAYPIPEGEAVSGLRLVLGARIPGDERLVVLDVPVRPVLRNLERAGNPDPSPSPAGSA
jgi:hypothetical protein